MAGAAGTEEGTCFSEGEEFKARRSTARGARQLNCQRDPEKGKGGKKKNIKPNTQ